MALGDELILLDEMKEEAKERDWEEELRTIIEKLIRK